MDTACIRGITEDIAHVLDNFTGDMVTEVLPLLEFVYLGCQPVWADLLQSNQAAHLNHSMFFISIQPLSSQSFRYVINPFITYLESVLMVRVCRLVLFQGPS